MKRESLEYAHGTPDVLALHTRAGRRLPIALVVRMQLIEAEGGRVEAKVMRDDSGESVTLRIDPKDGSEELRDEMRGFGLGTSHSGGRAYFAGEWDVAAVRRNPTRRAMRRNPVKKAQPRRHWSAQVSWWYPGIKKLGDPSARIDVVDFERHRFVPSSDTEAARHGSSLTYYEGMIRFEHDVPFFREDGVWFPYSGKPASVSFRQNLRNKLSVPDDALRSMGVAGYTLFCDMYDRLLRWLEAHPKDATETWYEASPDAQPRRNPTRQGAR